MADKKVSQLPALTGANTAAGDLLYIVDVSEPIAADQSKKITLTEFQSAPVSAGTANGVLYLNGSKAPTSGSGLTYDGTTLAASNFSTGGSVTLSGGTANGVPYLNGSKVVTTGSALTFDGTTFGVSVAGAAVGRFAGGANTYFDVTDGTGNFRVQLLSNNPHIGSSTNNDVIFIRNNAEQMRLTSTGLGIGTSTPRSILSVAGSVAPALTIENTDTTMSAGQLYGSVDWYGNDASVGASGIRAQISSIEETGQGATSIVFSNTAASSTTLTERLRIDSSGNLGIGTTSPNYKLQVSGTTGQTFSIERVASSIGSSTALGTIVGTGEIPTLTADGASIQFLGAGTWSSTSSPGRIVFNTTPAATTTPVERFQLAAGEAVFNEPGNDYDFRVESDTNTHAFFVQASDGNVGIGTSSLAGRLTIGGYGSSNQTPDIQITRSSSGTAIQTGPNITFADGTTNNTTTLQVTQGRFGVWNYGAGSWQERLSIDSSGNLGLGVTPSVWALSGLQAFQIKNGAIYGYNDDEVGVTANCSYDSGIGDWKYISTGSNSTRYRQVSGIHSWFTAPSGTAGNPIPFTQRMTLTEAGNLGLGQTSPTAFTNYQGITTNGSVGSFIDLQSNGTTGGRLQCDTTYPGLFLQTTGAQPLVFATNATERARINATGDLVGAGTTSIIYWEGVYNNTTASAANMFVASNGSFARSTSALKYKQDIRNLENVDIDSIRAVRYKSKCDNDDQTKDHFGVIADEVDQAGIKELVNYGPNGEVEGFQYERLTVVLLKELQSLRARVAQLEGN